ncbi:MAG TPA: efflux RND transporter periplasmic adaptor subunit [Chthoniobacterales bacterium]|nr:efflux RND transporter periplasmic adaptor subunit [Chthoniobacterales bacterium]
MEPKKKLRGPLAIAIGGLLVLVILLVGIKVLQIKKMMSTPMQMPPATVSSVVVKEEAWAPTISAIGSISAVQGAVVSTELGGVVAQISFQNGGEAKKGDVLVRLAALTEDADLELARSDLDRTRDLAKRRVISKAELDAAESKFKQKEGAVAKKEVRAPFDGQLGIRQVNVGQMINPGQQVVQLTALDPVYVDFSLPEQYLPQLTNGLEVNVRADALGGREFKGKLTAVNSMVDSVTRNITAQATLANPEHVLHPGMFAKVEVVLPSKGKALVIPGSAVSYAPFGDSVYIIEKKKDEKTGKESQVLRQQFVRIGESRGDFVSVTQGLKGGETIVSTGVFKLRNGMAANINNDLAPKPQLKPNPPDS